MRQLWLGIFALWVAAGAASAQADPDRLAVQARGVLRAHCQACHGPGPGARAGLSLEDRELVVAKRRLIQPGDAGASELLDRVAGGAMPPGDHPRVPPKQVDLLRQWIDAGAPAAPQPGDDYVLRRITRDWAGLNGEGSSSPRPSAGDRAAVRYLSLNHLLRGNDGPEQLAAARKELEQALAATGRGPAKLVPIDPEDSIFRLLLTDLGWERRPFAEFNLKADDQRVGPSSLNLYDLILLEYPYAYLNFSSPDFPALAGMLRQTKAVRPIPYVRGDWLTAVLTGSPLGGELAAAVGRGPHRPAESAFFSGKVELEEAAAELGWKKGVAELQKELTDAGLEEFGRGEGVGRQAWEKAFPRLAERLGLGKAILPIDALSVLNLRGETDLEVGIETSDAKGKPKKRFRTEDDMQIRLRPSRRAAVELINTTVKGTVYPLLAPAEVLAAGRPKKLPVESATYTVENDLGTEQLTAFAVTAAVLPGDKTGALRGQLLRAEKVKGMRDRYVHPRLYELRDDNKGFSSPVASHLLKVSVGFEVTKK